MTYIHVRQGLRDDSVQVGASVTNEIEPPLGINIIIIISSSSSSSSSSNVQVGASVTNEIETADAATFANGNSNNNNNNSSNNNSMSLSDR